MLVVLIVGAVVSLMMLLESLDGTSSFGTGE